MIESEVSDEPAGEISSEEDDLSDSDESILTLDEDKIKKVPNKKLWDEIGFHRPAAGFWYKLIYELLIILIPVFLVSFMLKYIYPFPTSQGYRKTFTALFVLVFRVFDIGTSNTISRFIADENIKNPNKMIQYIQYFIWYQAFSGLLQITAISYWCLVMVADTQLAYGIWIMLICVSKQWPGFPGVFKGVLNALQQFGKKSTVDFIQGEAIQRFTEIGFVLLGRWYGMNNPAVGEILGISIGATFGLYIDDIIASVFAGWLLSKSLEDYNISFLRLFGVEFDWKLVKECFIFGVKTGLPGIVFASTKMIVLTLSLTFIPQYTTFVVLHDMAYMLVAMTQRLTNQDFTPLFTEAYQNGKIKLCQYYNAHAIRFLTLNTGFAVAIMLTVASVLERVFVGLGLDLYLLSLPFVIPALLYRASISYNRYPDAILIGAGRANEILVIKVVEELLKMLCWYLTIVVFNVPSMGIGGIVYTLTLGDYPAVILKMIFVFLYINKKIFKLKFMVWQTFVAPAVATAILYTIFYLLRNLVLVHMWGWNFILTLIIAVIVLMIMVFAFYFPLTVFLGGWDENSIRDFRKIEKMSGPSRFLVTPMARIIFKTVPHAKLHNRFKYDEKEALREIKELMQERNKNRELAFK